MKSVAPTQRHKVKICELLKEIEFNCILFIESSKSKIIRVFGLQHFLTHLYNIDIEGFENFRKKISPMGFEPTTATTTGLKF